MRAYDRLFADALRDRERPENAVVFTFGADSATQARVEELARREAACCPFADYRVEIAGDDRDLDDQSGETAPASRSCSTPSTHSPTIPARTSAACSS